MTTIELGEISGTSGHRPETSRRLGLDRRLIVTTDAVLSLVVVAGSAVPHGRGIRPLWSAPAASTQGTALTADTVYVYGASVVIAYDLGSGTIRWQRPLADPVGYLQVAEPAGLLLIPADG